MSRAVYHIMENGVYVLPIRSLIMRINRVLGKLDPARLLYYNTHQKDYYIQVKGAVNGDTQIGPIYYSYLIALADHINLWTLREREFKDKAVNDFYGKTYTQQPLPKHMRFGVVTETLQEAIKAVENAGGKVVWSDYWASKRGRVPDPVPTVTVSQEPFAAQPETSGDGDIPYVEYDGPEDENGRPILDEPETTDTHGGR